MKEGVDGEARRGNCERGSLSLRGSFYTLAEIGPRRGAFMRRVGDEAKNVKTTRGNPVNKKAVGCADTLIKLDPFDCAKPRMHDIAVLLRLG